MDTLASYDELPYDSLPLPETQPDFLAALARLHGVEAPDPACARILELGCASGGNLIPLAWRWPASQCVGVELSRVQAEAGADFVRALGLPNVRIVHGDLAALPADLGEFDYIIAHGVFSWVPPAVREALLEICRRHLSVRGIAYVSFNVAAGWRSLEPLRAALLARTGADLPAPARYEAALKVLDELEAQWTAPALRKEIAYLRAAAPSYLFHEYLAEFNASFGFERFALDLAAHALRYVAEAGPRHAVVAFDDGEADPRRRTERWRDAEADLQAAAGSVMVDCGVAAEVYDGAFRAALFQLVIAHAVMPTLNSGRAVIDPGSHPRANALARLQARSPGWVVSGRRHVAIDLDAAGRALLALLDGSRSLPELSEAMQAWLAAAGGDLPEAAVTELTARQLWLFVRQGLLEET